MNKYELYITQINVHTTTKCTLKCKKCSWSFPYFEPHIHSDADLIVHSLEGVFQVYENVHELSIAGAEAFLHPGINEIITGAAKYCNQFDVMRIVTNGTYIPNKSILNTISSLPCDVFVRVDDYGKLSGKKQEIVSALKEYGIKTDLRPYNEEEQAFGGWIDLGEYKYKNYSKEQLKDVFRRCKMPLDCSVLWDGRLYNCPYCISGFKLGKIPMARREYVDLFDDTTIEDKRALIKAWKDEPFDGCAYCNGYDPEASPRIPAAEQL